MWSAPLAVPVVLGVMLLVLWVLGKLAVFDSQENEAMLILVSALAVCLGSAGVAEVLMRSETSRVAGLGMAVLGGGMVVLAGGVAFAALALI